MKLSDAPELVTFFSTYLADADSSRDLEQAQAFSSVAPVDRQLKVIEQIKALLGSSALPLDDLGSEANRWFGEEAEARAWLEGVLAALDSARPAASNEVVKDSNGTPLSEGDSVQVIKDLKVKGGSSDLKRGTLIKKIHLVGDPEVVECRVDGSTLVLKTCFLKRI